jgi:DNA-binding MarR family transcriptional regulator
MQPLRSESILTASAERCAQQVLAGAPLIMRFIRSEMRGHRQTELSIPQFRALVFVTHRAEASLSALAEHIGLSLPAASRMVEQLVKRGLMERRTRPGDRRCVSLALTRRGKAVFATARRATQAALARRFEALSAQELSVISAALGILDGVFATGGDGRAGK